MKERIMPKFTPWKVGDKVWLEGKNLQLHYPTRKLAPRREGPFEISHVISPLAYRLQLPPTWKIHDVFHASLLSTYRETAEHRPNYANPPPEEIEGEEEYEIAEILSHWDPLTAILISYLGKATHPPKTPGNLNRTYNTPKQYSRSTSNGGTSKKTELRGVNLCVLEPPLFALSQILWCKPLCFRAALLVLRHVVLVQFLSFTPRTS